MSRTRSPRRSGRSRPPVPEEVRRARGPLFGRLAGVSVADEHRLRRELHRASTIERIDQIASEIDSAEADLERRQGLVPQIGFPAELPVAGRRDEIAEAIRDNQVVVIAGETGSGKTTQIPKICLELGRGVRGRIGHTQPRRLAARTVADRIASELGVEIGTLVGSSVRFDDRTSPDTAVKLMTDGILLQEIRRDRLLRAYDTIIIDEAHERSLNIDFLLGYLAEILPKRPDLKVVITSATIDPQRFARHFADSTGVPAPIIDVSGRTYPVEIRYRPPEVLQGDRLVDLDPLEALADAVDELMRLGDGDILVFLSGEREIRDAEEVLRGRKYRNTEIFPLFARLTTAEQNRAYRQHSKRRIVLSTNIAETSVTVPGIHYVIDTGLARISRYSVRTKVQRLPIERISQASANQRSGRCGRVTDGVAIRLYSEEDFESRPEFTDPEILRTNLASVILSMADLGIGPIEEFGFVEPPDRRAVRDGVNLLTELHAIELDDRGNIRLTKTGRDMAALPLDPRLARMLAEAQRNGSLSDVITIVAALSIQDVRERPAEERDKADQYHRRFSDKTSDFLGYLNLWRYLDEQRRGLSGSAFRKMCKAEYLHWLRIREWQDLSGQLAGICRDHGWHPKSGQAADDDIHKALLSGLLSNVGLRVEETRDFNGARGVKFQVFPGSSLSKKPPRWLMASELVETSRLWARDVARIDPSWVEPLAAHLVKKQYSEPHWSSKQGAAMAYERVTLYGLPVVEQRRILLSRVDAPLARELFVRHGLVEGGWSTTIEVLCDNAEAVENAREMETRSRRRDLVIDDEALVQFYLDRLPADITSGRHLESWWKKRGRNAPDALRLTESDLRTSAGGPSAQDFPPAWRQGDLTFELEYTFDPEADTDGITVRIPLPQLSSVKATGFEWLVPGVREELYTEMLRTLPKYLRRMCSPPADFAALLAGDLTPRSAPLSAALAEALSARIGTTVDASDFRPVELPDHLRMRFAVVDGDRVVDDGYSLPALRQKLETAVRDRLAGDLVPDDGPHRRWTAETIGDLDQEVRRELDGVVVTAFPALKVADDGIHRIACATAAEQKAAQTAAVLTLLCPGLVESKSLLKGRSVQERLALTQYPHGGVDTLVHDAVVGVLAVVLAQAGGPPFTVESYESLRAVARREVPSRVSKRIAGALPALVIYQEVQRNLEAAPRSVRAEVEDSLDFLLGRGFLARHSPERIAHLERHAKAAALRLELAQQNPGRHEQLSSAVGEIAERVSKAVSGIKARPGGAKRARDLQWMLAEYRVSVFAQSLGTSQTVSPERIDKAIAAATGRSR